MTLNPLKWLHSSTPSAATAPASTPSAPGESGAQKTGRLLALLGKWCGKAIILGIEQHPDVVPKLAAAIATRSIDTSTLVELGQAVAEGAAAEGAPAQ